MPNSPLLGHLVAGAATFTLFWVTMLTVKGSPSHRRRGRLFFLSLLPLSSVLLLSSAVHGTLLAAVYRSLVDRHGFDPAQLVTQPATLLLALALRVHLGRRRGVPMRFAADPRPRPI